MARRLAAGARLVLATHNAGKLREIGALLAPHGVDTVAAAALGLAEPEESAPDFVGNARLKALAASTAAGLPALADDSGFCVAALAGAPGVLSARWAGPERAFAAAMQLVHERMAGAADRRAWFVSVLCLAWPDGHTATFMGRVEGTAVWPPRGNQGFGYDPMFQPAGSERTYGETSPADKQQNSHCWRPASASYGGRPGAAGPASRNTGLAVTSTATPLAASEASSLARGKRR
jgi:XTP/dITP diphosphohydrolase